MSTYEIVENIVFNGLKDVIDNFEGIFSGIGSMSIYIGENMNQTLLNDAFEISVMITFLNECIECINIIKDNTKLEIDIPAYLSDEIIEITKIDKDIVLHLKKVCKLLNDKYCEILNYINDGVEVEK